jgi:hypothetical protein
VAFPTTQLPVMVELQLNGTWTDITSKVYTRDPITIKRGRSSEGQNVDPSTCQLTLDNRGGTFSPRNPTGPYYGTLGRNTPLRVSVTGMDDNSLQTTGSLAGIASTPTATALNTTSDLDLRVEVAPFNLYGSSQDWIGKWDVTAGQASYLLWNDNVGNLYLSWTTGRHQRHAGERQLHGPRAEGQQPTVRCPGHPDGLHGHRDVLLRRQHHGDVAAAR